MPKCPPAKARVDVQGPFAAADRLVEREPVVMHDAEIVMAMRVHRVEHCRALASGKGVVEAALHAVNLAQIAVKQRRSRLERNRTLHQCRGVRRAGRGGR